MDPRDIICLILILIGVFFIVRSFVHRRKGMWGLGNDDFAEPWDPVNPKIPHSRSSRGRIDSPYQETQIGILFIAMGALFAIQLTFGLRVFAITLIAFCAAYIVYNIIRIRYFDEDDDDLHVTRTVNLIISGCAAGIGVFLLVMI